ncbi:hypothetical protein EON83_21470 [bacterium]|nr:MAG: hypothetical protein EON83_21470 [bacterium]
MRKLSLLLFLACTVTEAATAAHAQQNQTDDLRPAIKLACIGDSITAGSGTSNSFFAYPSQLQRMLGKKWEVRNFGVSATTLLNSGDKPYQKESAMKNALEFKPNVVVIMLGTNDSKPQNWAFNEQFGADYRDLISKFKALETHPRIVVCNPPLVPGAGNFGINEPAVLKEIPLIKIMAEQEKVEVVDVHGAFADKDALFPDRVHPNNEGASVLAKTVYAGVTGEKWQGDVPDVTLSDWNGFEQKSFVVANRSCLLVSPKTTAPGNPWIWRTEFFGHEPQGDIGLLKKGYHVVYMDVQNMYGAPVAIDLMDKFYAALTTRFQLSPKATLEGFSRGGLFALNWAIRNPNQVASLYLDAPLCDLKNWPTPSPDWENLKKVYGLTEEKARAYTLSPIDHLKPLVDAKIPILGVYGMADTTVIPAKNIELLAQRYRDMGGEIELIPKPGIDHHPHSLVDPTPIVDFVVKHS